MALARTFIATSNAPVDAPTRSSSANKSAGEGASAGSMPAAANVAVVSGTSRGPMRSARRPVSTIAGSAARATAKRTSPSCPLPAPTPRRIAGRDDAHAPHHSPKPANAAASCGALELEIPIDEVVFLEPAKSFANLARAHGANAGDRLQVALRRADDGFEPVHVLDDPPRDVLRQPRNVGKDPEAARGDGVVERIHVARVPEDLRQPLHVEQLRVPQRLQVPQCRARGLLGRVDV